MILGSRMARSSRPLEANGSQNQISTLKRDSVMEEMLVSRQRDLISGGKFVQPGPGVESLLSNGKWCASCGKSVSGRERDFENSIAVM